MINEIKILGLNRVHRFFGKNTLLKLDMAVTYKCDLRCEYCNIWKTKPRKELNLEQYENFFKSVSTPILHLTGGEPFLRHDFLDIVIASQKIKRLVLVDTSTNGFSTKNIVSQCKKIVENIGSRFEVGVSIDGVRKIHNKSRGVKSFRNAIKTYFKLADLFLEFKNAHVHLNHYLSPLNNSSFPEFLGLLEDKGVSVNNLSVDVFRVSQFFMNNSEEMNRDLVLNNLKLYHSKLSGFSYRIFLRKMFVKLLIDFIGNNSRIPCSAGKSSLFIDPYGFVYPCSSWKKPLFNINERIDLLNNLKVKRWNSSYDCRSCFSGCEGVSSIIHGFPFFRKILF